MRLRGRLAAVVCLALLTAASGARAVSGRAPADATVLVRVVADVTVDFDGVKEPIERKDVELATGSGFVVAPSGLVLTSRHVIVAEGPAPRGGAPEAKVSVDNRRVEVVIGPGGPERTFVAWVAGADEETDLAALQVAASDLAYLPLGDSDALQPGRAVQVLGFPFGRQVEVGRRSQTGLNPAVTVAAGSLSAARENDEGQTRYLQTDAPLNPGSSGGPMLDADGYVVGVVRMKLARDATSQGAGFGVPVNLVKGFLDTNGLLGQLPVGWLRPGVLHTLDWKRLRIQMPDGYLDGSPSRLRAEMGEVEGIQCRIDRLPTPLTVDDLEPLLLKGDGLPGFAPGRLLRQEREPAGEDARHLVLGSALLEGHEGEPLRVEYAVYDVSAAVGGSQEKVVARYLGAPDAVAFNLGRIRASLRSLRADAMLLPEGRPVLPALRPGAEPPFTATVLPQAPDVGLPVPTGWVVEPIEGRACAGVPAPAAGLSASPREDYRLVLRARWWAAPAGLHARLGACSGTPHRFLRFGSDLAVQGVVLERGSQTLLLELEAPTAQVAAVAGVFDDWVEAVARSGFARR